MTYPPTNRVWVHTQNKPITDEQLKRLTILVQPNERRLEKRTAYEILVFITETEWNNCQDEKEMKKRIFAKFRSYNDAEEYGQKLILNNLAYFKVLLRK